MFFRRRGCLLGCSVFFALCVAFGLLGWYVGIPRFTGAIEDGLSESLATEISRDINPLYSPSELQDGQDVRFSFDSINRTLDDSNSDNPEDTVRITTSGNRILMRAEIQGQGFDAAFVPSVSSDGKLELDPVDEGGWWMKQFMNILSGGFEGGINEWLEVNGLILTGVELDGDGIILSVAGK